MKPTLIFLTEWKQTLKKRRARYEEILKNLGGIDLQILGLGHNGHIGFNEPSDIFPKDTHIVNLQESTIEANKRFFASSDQVPRQAYTMGIGTIIRAKKILLMVSGEDKAEILHTSLCGPGNTKSSRLHSPASSKML